MPTYGQYDRPNKLLTISTPLPSASIECVTLQVVEPQSAASGVVWLGTHVGQSQAELDGFKARALRAASPAQPRLRRMNGGTAPPQLLSSFASGKAVSDNAPAAKHTMPLEAIATMIERTAGDTVDVDVPLMEAVSYTHLTLPTICSV